jgi:hypothetical protein
MRTFLRTVLWVVLLVFLVLDYRIAAYLIHGPDLIFFDSQGRMLPKPSLSARDYTILAVLLLAQVSLALAQFRLRQRRPPPSR